MVSEMLAKSPPPAMEPVFGSSAPPFLIAPSGPTADGCWTGCSGFALRAEKQPLDFPSCGSVFKRPPGYFAGSLIEAAGFKGERIGGAEVSRKHAGFILNRGGATAEDVHRLICRIERRVFERFGVRLEREVQLVGEFEA